MLVLGWCHCFFRCFCFNWYHLWFTSDASRPFFSSLFHSTGLVYDIVSRGGRCLIPAFALGRAQELMLILDEFWDSHPELHSVPIYYASQLARKCMSVYQTYVHAMNDKVRHQLVNNNPFVFRHIANLKVRRTAGRLPYTLRIMKLDGCLHSLYLAEHGPIWWYRSLRHHGQSWDDAERPQSRAVWELVHGPSKRCHYRWLLRWRHFSQADSVPSDRGTDVQRSDATPQVFCGLHILLCSHGLPADVRLRASVEAGPHCKQCVYFQPACGCVGVKAQFFLEIWKWHV